MSIGERIRDRRKFLGLTQEELASKAQVSAMSVRRYENNERRIKLDTIRRFASCLECDVEDLLEPGEHATLIREKMIDGLNGNSTNDTTLLRYFHRLNDEGKKVAIERTKELTEISRYFSYTPSIKED